MSSYWIAALVTAILLLLVGWLSAIAWAAGRKTVALRSQLWERISPGDDPNPTLFYESQVAEMPEVVQRYFRWSLDDGAPLARVARLRMIGRIRLGRGKPWIPLSSEETIHAGEGFLWTASVRATVPIDGSDSFVDGRGEMSWRLLGLLPVMNAADANISRSARGRFVAEWFFVPGALFPGDRVKWEALGPYRARITVENGGVAHPITVDFDPDGMPRKISFARWGNFETADGAWQEIPYAVRCEGVFRHGGYTLPRAYTASWWAGTERELPVVELEIENAEFR